MARTAHQAAFAACLHELKTRSGRSYQALGRRCGVSASTLHRYCTGGGVPAEFGTVERLGRLCGAGRKELADLHRLWVFAQVQPEVERADEPEPQAPATTTNEPAPAARRYSRRTLAVVGTALAIVLTVGFVVASQTSPMQVSPASTRPLPTAAPWTRPPVPVPGQLFGVTLNSATGAMPTFHTGAVRLWDSETRWATIEPERGRYDWTVVERLVAGAEQAGLPTLFVLGGTPGWAAPNAPRMPYPDGSRAAPPDQLSDWEEFVRALVQRYRGRFEAYELWVLGNDPRYYNGSVETLVEMTRRASRQIRAADPKAIVVCPGMGRLWQPDAQQVLRRFAELGGYQYCDVAGVKLHQRSATDPPETMLDLVATIDRTMHAAGVHPKLWNTGTTEVPPVARRLSNMVR